MAFINWALWVLWNKFNICGLFIKAINVIKTFLEITKPTKFLFIKSETQFPFNDLNFSKKPY
jgi:hypothetical protein